MRMMNKLWLMLAAIALSFSSLNASAQTLPETEFQDQFEKPINLDAQTKWLLLSSDKASGKLVKESLEALELSDLAAKNGLYVADVSAMPGLITKLFAIPKMKDYAFNIAVVNDENQLADWPKQESKVSAIQLNELEVTSVEYFDSEEALQAWIKQQF